MGHPDQFAKRTFAEETERVTGGALAWQDPPEIGLVKVQGDGVLQVRRPEALARLVAPWSEAKGHDEIWVELKMPGDHIDPKAVERAFLRRQARQVQRMETVKEGEAPWLGQEPLWLVAPHVPGWLEETRMLTEIAPGCYRVDSAGWFPFLWIAANELPVKDELVPFLVARSGRALDELARWSWHRRSLDWLYAMVKYTSMSTTMRSVWMDMLLKKEEDPEIESRMEDILRTLLDGRPQVKQQLIEKGRLSATRDALRRVLAQRRFTLNPDDEARVEACDDLATLQRWLDQAITAGTVAEALQ